MAAYRKLAEKYPSCRGRSKTNDLIVEISLQPWAAFCPDGVIIFSDILTPLPAFRVLFDMEEVRGPVIHSTLRTENELKALHSINFEKLHFVGESLRILHHEAGEQAVVFGFVGAPWTIVAYIEQAVVFGFVGAPWTIAAYIVEGSSTCTYTVIKRMCHTAPHVLKQPLLHLTEAISCYIVFQVTFGAHCIQIFDSWGGQLSPDMGDHWSKPYIKQIVDAVRKKCPKTPLVPCINGNGGLSEGMKETTVDVVGLDWTVDMEDGRKRSWNDYRDPLCGEIEKVVQSLMLVGIQKLEHSAVNLTESLQHGGAVESSSNKANHQADDQLYEEMTFDRCFYIYRGPEQLQELEALSNHCALLFNRRKAKLSSELRSFYDGRLKAVQQIVDLSTQTETITAESKQGQKIKTKSEVSDN
ncbi:hypothetical protein Nepgr_025469 [Nepenthes gracilis]|uniref:Uroporphyrinogen decarboxylase (URO-D) domain-containing protein n=1 Tax=Nepenthes gracilis TaxID=150966 RepID=A0AAD3Y1I8_NEPGR|nr:hypothetical protein Nepgr_025469 [Nepenthes gracilis]